MEGLSSAGEQRSSWKRVEARPSDEVLAPIFPSPTSRRAPEAARPAETLSSQTRLDYFRRADAQKTRAEAAIVDRELALGNSTEEYWQKLCDAFNDRTARREELAEEGIDTTADRAVIQKIRWEMNALIPKLAEARVRRDAGSFSDPKMYADRLEKQFTHAERTAAFAQGDEIAMRSAIDNARIARAQLEALKRLNSHPDAWRLLRIRAIGGEARSVLSTLPSEPTQRESWRIELSELQAKMNRLQADRAKLNIWNIFAKADIDKDLSSKRLREAFLIRKVNQPS